MSDGIIDEDGGIHEDEDEVHVEEVPRESVTKLIRTVADKPQDQIDKEPIPDFSNTASSNEIKLLKDIHIIEERRLRQRRALSVNSQVKTTSSIMRSCEVYATKATHSRRHSGTTETY
ncbi:hypothetical protein BGZ80_006952 [Entomortierella chlamydospora]|uniref:Uncharacterized protein n=1 Tax=Entomortierella chlamydospora TaxID=101097 RepID=A0A9P6MYK4_9FUNG|nr:hypothetical protein BGZ80_006952 [Entomortierella chlamydospora]